MKGAVRGVLNLKEDATGPTCANLIDDDREHPGEHIRAPPETGTTTAWDSVRRWRWKHPIVCHNATRAPRYKIRYVRRRQDVSYSASEEARNDQLPHKVSRMHIHVDRCCLTHTGMGARQSRAGPRYCAPHTGKDCIPSSHWSAQTGRRSDCTLGRHHETRSAHFE